jgi:hypothetical protein
LSVIFVSINKRRRVRLLAEIETTLPREHVWHAMSHLEAFTTCDPFHTRVRSVDNAPIAHGSSIKIIHGFFGVGITRVGRVLRWEENTGYAFSDLSPRGPKLGFPHIYGYRLRDLPGGGCALTVSVRGVWTMRALPRRYVAAWLTGVMWLIEMLLRRRLARL